MASLTKIIDYVMVLLAWTENDKQQNQNLLTDMVTDTLKEAEEFMGVKFQPVVEQVAYLDGGSGILYFPHLNISNVSIWHDLDKDFADTSLVDSDDYTIYAERGIVKCNGWKFTKGNQVIKVQYDGGYTEAALPSDLRGKLAKQIAKNFRRRKDDELMSVTYPDGTINKYDIGEWLPDVEDVLRRYGRIVI